MLIPSKIHGLGGVSYPGHFRPAIAHLRYTSGVNIKIHEAQGTRPHGNDEDPPFTRRVSFVAFDSSLSVDVRIDCKISNVILDQGRSGGCTVCVGTYLHVAHPLRTLWWNCLTRGFDCRSPSSTTLYPETKAIPRPGRRHISDCLVVARWLSRSDPRAARARKTSQKRKQVGKVYVGMFSVMDPLLHSINGGAAWISSPVRGINLGIDSESLG